MRPNPFGRAGAAAARKAPAAAKPAAKPSAGVLDAQAGVGAKFAKQQVLPFCLANLPQLWIQNAAAFGSKAPPPCMAPTLSSLRASCPGGGSYHTSSTHPGGRALRLNGTGAGA